jgi:hypothetical protein
MITNERMAIRTAKSLVAFLESKGIETKTDYAYKPIRKILRECWYVKKLVECGQTECIHIDLPKCSGFIAVTDNCKLMSGNHIMINDAAECIFYEYSTSEDFCLLRFYDTLRQKQQRLYTEDNWGEHGLFLTEPYVFRNWVNSLELNSDGDDFGEF